MKIQVLSGGKFKLDGGAMHGVVPKSLWEKANPANENNLCTWQMRCLLIEDGKQLILIDTGMGNKQPEKWQNYFDPEGHTLLKDNIKKLGFGPNEVTDVILSHLHFDHCGGAVEISDGKLQPTFGNAKYWTHSGHLASAQKPNAREKATFLKENIEPLLHNQQLHFIDRQAESPFENIEMLVADGHTEKMLMPLIKHPKGKLLFAADTIPSAYHIHIPFVMSYDVRPLKTMLEKEVILNRCIDENIHLVFDHDLQHECCQIIKDDRGFKALHSDSLFSHGF